MPSRAKPIHGRLTWEKFDKLYTDLLTYCMVDDERLRLETLEAGHVGCLKHMMVAVEDVLPDVP